MTLAAVELASKSSDQETHAKPTDDASRSFILRLPAGVAVDLRVGQHLHGQLEWSSDGMWMYSMNASIADDQGIVFAYDPQDAKSPAYAQGSKTKLFPAEKFEDILGIAVTLDGKKRQIVGWQSMPVAGKPYLLYGYANRLKPGARVNDYPSHTTFAMVRSPG